MSDRQIAIIGGGPTGLMAAEQLARLGHAVTVYEQMPTVARKFLLAGKSGLNITHSEDLAAFIRRYAGSARRIAPALDQFGPQALRQWADELGAETFTGSSGRVFPKAMKASPLLRAWLARLQQLGVTIRTRHRWQGFADGKLLIANGDGVREIAPDAVLFALGGASYPRLGSDADWVAAFAGLGIKQQKLQPANCGFTVDWSEHLVRHHAGAAVKSVTITSPAGTTQGEFVISHYGVEGSLVYGHASALRDQLNEKGSASLQLDLVPGRSLERLTGDLQRQNAKQSLASLLRKGAGLTGVKAALVTEVSRDKDPVRLAQLIKALPIAVLEPRPIAEAISSAGGIDWSEIDDHYMLVQQPGLFVGGEMIDWEAPTGGYLLTACFAMGVAAANGMDHWLRSQG